MRKAHLFFFGFLIALIAFVMTDLGGRMERIKVARMVHQIPKNSGTLAAASVPGTTTEAQVQVTEKTGLPFLKRFQLEASHIGKIQAKPELAQQRMQLLAKAMTSNDVEQMFDIISDDKANPDQRALAVELLSIKNDAASLQALQNFVANSKNINGVKWDQKKELETVLRAQAVESIANFPEKDIALSTLSFLQQKVEQRFLSDRISRASLSIMTGTKPTPQQDEEALKKLVE